MSESCNSRHFSWLMKSCLPNNKSLSSQPPIASQSQTQTQSSVTNISSLPDDLLLECLSRVPSSSLSSLSFVCRRWSRLLLSPSFFRLRRQLNHIHNTVFAINATASSLFTATLLDKSNWKIDVYDSSSFMSGNFGAALSQARLSPIGPRIYIISKNTTFLYDTWTSTIIPRSPMLSPRKKFSTAVVYGKIYIAGGGGSSPSATVDEYDPDTNSWRVVCNAPRVRYGCIGASVDGVFYIIGGLKIGDAAGAHVYASSMDLYDVEARVWLRSRTVPGGGCAVAACAAVGHVYILASHAVELSFWRFSAARRNHRFGEWSRLKSPPLPIQVRVDSSVKFSCVGVGDKVVLVQVMGCIDDLLRRSGRNLRGLREGLVLVYDTVAGDWSRGPDVPEVMQRAAVVSLEC